MIPNDESAKLAAMV